MDATWHDETRCKIKQVSYSACSKRSHGSTHTLNTSFKHNLPEIATKHFAIKETTCYRKPMGIKMTCTSSTDYILQISSRFRFIGIKINPT